MQTSSIPRRQFFRLLGAGALLGTVGTASASEGRYIVGTRSRSARREAQRQAQAVHRVLDFGAFGSAVAGRFSEQALRGLSRRPDVDYVEADGVYHAIAIADLDNYDGEIPWGVDRVDAEKVWDDNGSVSDPSLAGFGAKVAIVDTGIANDHPDLVDNLVGGISYTVGPYWRNDTSTDPKDWNDGNGHGTHCAGTVAAVKNGLGHASVAGVAPSASLYAVKVLDDRGSGYMSDVAAGITWAGDNGMDVASMSLGGGHSEAVERAVKDAASKGVLLVAAAGNDGLGTADEHFPSAHSEVVAVGATERFKDSSGERWDSLASFSSTGSTVEIAAPGVAITSTWKNGGYNTISGTSMACPHVSGAGALLMAAGYDAASARTQLAGTAEWPVWDGEAGREMDATEIGNGLLDVQAAVGDTSGGDGGTTEDTTAPTAPSNLTGTATGETTVDLSWTGSTDDGTGVSHYTVYRDGAPELETSSTAATVTGLTAGTTYSFYVTATDGAANESDASNTVSVTTDAASGGSDTTAPTGNVGAIREVQSRNPHAEFEVPLDANDDTELASVELVLTDDSDSNAFEESVTVDVAGQPSADGTVALKAHKDDGQGHSYTVTMTVTDAAGNEGTATGSVTEA